MIKLVDQIDLNEVHKELAHDGAGGTCVFVGTVRDNSQGKEVNKLFFESYDEMAISEMETIRSYSLEKWGLKRVVLVHATGAKELGDPVVVVGASSAHRKEAFEACRYLIDELKRTVPIWKKEFFTDETVWVQPTP